MENNITILSSSKIKVISGGKDAHTTIITNNPENYKNLKMIPCGGCCISGTAKTIRGDSLMCSSSDSFKENKITMLNKNGAIVSEKIF